MGSPRAWPPALAVNADIPVQDVPYDKLRQKLEALEQKLEAGPGADSIVSRSLISQYVGSRMKEWNSQKKGWEWLFPHIDTNC